MTRMLIALVASLLSFDARPQVPLYPATPVAPADPGTAACCRIAAGTVVALEILDPLNSSQRKRGDTFALRVVTPLVVDGHELVPAGTTAIGQVVHAAAARGGGAPGELLIAARSLDVRGQSVPLRGLKLGVTGGDNSGMALGVSFAAGPFALFIRGREIEIPALTRVEARLASEITLVPDPAAVVPPIESVSPTKE